MIYYKLIKKLLFLITTSSIFVIIFIEIIKSTQSRDTFHLSIDVPVSIPERLKSSTTAKYPQSTTEGEKCFLIYKDFCVLYDLVKATEKVDEDDSVTLSTQATPEYIHHVKELCARWGGPISVAIYGPGDMYLDARINIEILRKCDACIRRWVTWHVFFDHNHIPALNDTNFHEDVTSNHNCTLKTKENSYREIHKLPYPINVARNIARSKAKTHFVFASDIELYPSDNIIPRFLEMIRRSDRNVSSRNRREVWVLPVFEVKPDVQVPGGKTQLYSLYKRSKAVSFHKYRCDICHRIPNLTQWLKTSGDKEQLHVFSTVKRQKRFKLQMWEPFFIGTKEEPEYESHLTWEGKQNKMQVSYEMCQMDYDFNILDDAFLVHSPGINKYNSRSPVEKMRSRYLAKNAKILRKTMQNLKRKYKNSLC